VLITCLTDLPPVHGVRWNPPVFINNWSDPEDEDEDAASDGEPPFGKEEGDRPYIEHDGPEGIEPENEPAMADECRDPLSLCLVANPYVVATLIVVL
jgi:hypothetical protein